MRTIAITGTSGFAGSMLLGALLQERRGSRIIAIDMENPGRQHSHRCKFVEIDLTDPESSVRLARVLSDAGCDTLVHAALPTQPRKDVEALHEVQSIGTMYLLYAAAKAGVSHCVLASTTDVYGAFPDNPNFLVEAHPLRGGSMSAFLRDKVDVERQFLSLQKAHAKMAVTILRPCTILGPAVHNYKTHYLQNSVIPTVMGYDPLVQFVHESDVVRAFCHAIRRRAAGAFNIVGNGTLPLSRALAMMGKVRIPVPSPLLYMVGEALWQGNVSEAPPVHLNFIKYSYVADGEKARRGLGFSPVYSSQEALLSFVHAHRGKE